MKENDLLNNGAKAVLGLTQLEVTLGLSHVTKAMLEPIVLDAGARCVDFDTARDAKALAFETSRAQRHTADAYLLAGRDQLTTYLGSSASMAWVPLGFSPNSIALPTNDADRLDMLARFKAHFAAHPGRAGGPNNVTAVRSGQIHDDLKGALSGIDNCKVDARTKRDARDTAKRLLEKKLLALRKELGVVLDPLDPRWLKFFDRIPGDPRVPEAVEDVTATVAPGLISLDWPDAARAAHYRVLKLVVGTDADFVLAETVQDSEVELTDVPPGATVKLQIVPVNGAGTGTASEVIELLAA